MYIYLPSHSPSFACQFCVVFVHMQSTPVCNGSVTIVDQYDSSTSLAIPLSLNGTVVEFTTGLSEMNRVFNATFELMNSNGSFVEALDHNISEDVCSL